MSAETDALAARWKASKARAEHAAKRKREFDALVSEVTLRMQYACTMLANDIRLQGYMAICGKRKPWWKWPWRRRA